jgi:hypothetical protein
MKFKEGNCRKMIGKLILLYNLFKLLFIFYNPHKINGILRLIPISWNYKKKLHQKITCKLYREDEVDDQCHVA